MEISNEMSKDVTVEQTRATTKCEVVEDNRKIIKIKKEFMERNRYQVLLEKQIALHYHPDLVLEKILGFLSFDEISKARIVCRLFNKVCKRLLNRGYSSVKNFYTKCEEKMELMFPKRKCYPTSFFRSTFFFTKEILHIIDASSLLLDLTYLLSIKSNLCCFIPGKVLDEIYYVLFVIDNNYKIMSLNYCQDDNILKYEYKNNIIKDLSMKAIKHFIRKILSTYKKSWTSFPNVIGIPTNYTNRIVEDSLTGTLNVPTERLYNYTIDTGKIHLISLREELETALFRDKNQPNGLERGLQPEKILWKSFPITRDSESYILIKWKDTDEVEFINKEIVSKKFPELMNLYEEKLVEHVELQRRVLKLEEISFD